MTFSFLWFAVGVAVGVNATLAGLWWSLRRENRKPSRWTNEEATRWLSEEAAQRRANWDAERELRDSYGRPMPLASRRADP